MRYERQRTDSKPHGFASNLITDASNIIIFFCYTCADQMIVHTGEAFRLAPDTGFSFRTQAPNHLSRLACRMKIMHHSDSENNFSFQVI